MKKSVSLFFWIIISLQCAAAAQEARKISILNPESTNPIVTFVINDSTYQWSLKSVIEKKDIPEGIFKVDTTQIYAQSGFPVFYFLCYCPDYEYNHVFFLKFITKDKKQVIALTDAAGTVLISAPLKKSSPLIPQPKNRFTITNNILIDSEPPHISYSLSSIYANGNWSIDSTLVNKEYNTIITWECEPNIHKGYYCECDSSLGIDNLLDNPSCASDIRKAALALSKQNNLLHYTVLKTDATERKDIKKGMTYILSPKKESRISAEKGIK